MGNFTHYLNNFIFLSQSPQVADQLKCAIAHNSISYLLSPVNCQCSKKPLLYPIQKEKPGEVQTKQYVSLCLALILKLNLISS
jgi:hypothetical protein